MESSLAPAGDGKVRISIQVGTDEFAEAIDATFRRIAKSIKLPGFRPGKAPRKVIEARLGRGYIRNEALGDALGDYYRQALVDHDVDAIDLPEIDITEGLDDGPLAIEAVVEVRPSVGVAGYDDLKVQVPSPLPTDEEVDAQIDALRAQFADLETVSRSAADSDHVTMDVQASHNGLEVEGLTVTDYTYEVGAGAVVAEIDENLRGARAGDILDFGAAHPDPQTEGRLRFRILVKEVQARRLPDLDDDLVRSASEFDTVTELREDILERIGDAKRAQVRAELQGRIVEAVAALVIDEVPDAMVRTRAAERTDDFNAFLQSQDNDLQNYLATTGATETQFSEEIRRVAEGDVRLDLALRAVADAEDLQVSDLELRESTEREAERLGVDLDELHSRLDRTGGWSSLRAEHRKRLAMDWLMANVAVTDPDGIPIPRDLLAPTPPEPEADPGAENALPSDPDSAAGDEREPESDPEKVVIPEGEFILDHRPESHPGATADDEPSG